MRSSIQYRGHRFGIYALVLDDGRCPTVEFLAQVKRDDPASHRFLVHRYTAHAESGPSLNREQSRTIAGRENLFEFKSRRGDRLLYFYLPDSVTVLTNGFHKGARPSRSSTEPEG